MPVASPAERLPSRSARAQAPLALAALAVLAVEQPVLSVLRQAPEFFAIHGSTWSDLLFMVGVLGIAVPSVPLLAALATSRLEEPRRHWHTLHVGVWMAVLATAMLLPLVSKLGSSWWWLAIAGGVGLALSYPRSRPLRLFMGYLSLALVAVPATFLLAGGVRRAVSHGRAADVADAAISGEAPVVMVVFDEWTFGSLLDPAWVLAHTGSSEGAGDGMRVPAFEAGALDARRLPRLAELAGGATWYANATTVADTTENAVPAILSGRFPQPGQLPTLTDHPVNLFTRLADTYRIQAVESLTSLCPPDVNRYGTAAPSASSRRRLLLEDVAVVWLHAVTPPPLERGLPSVSQQWSGFVERREERERRGPENSPSDGAPAPRNDAEVVAAARRALESGDRPEVMERFIAAMQPGDRQLYFLHVMLPHVPWEYLPSGERYLAARTRIAGLVKERWTDDQELIDQAQQRYLLHVGFVDRLVGRLTDRLREVGLLDRALVVLTADHGTAFGPGTSRRLYEEGNAAEVAPIPLFVKWPGQRQGRVVSTPVTTLDLLPGMALALQARRAGDPGDDDPLIAADRARGGEQGGAGARFFTKYRGEQRLAADIHRQKLEAARHPSELLARAGDDPWRIGSHPELVGSPAHEHLAATSEGGRVELDADDLLAELRELPFVLDLLEGSLLRSSGQAPPSGCCGVAVAVGGEVLGSGPVYVDGARHRFSILAPLSARAGVDAESLELYRVDAAGRLHALERERVRAARLRRDGAGRVTSVELDGRVLGMDSALQGYFEQTQIEGTTVRVAGWAIDAAHRRPAERVLLFLGDELVASAPTGRAREAVADGYGEVFREAGFEAVLHLDEPDRLRRLGLVGVPVAGDDAGELGYFHRFLERDDHGVYRVESGNGQSAEVRSSAVEAWLDRVEDTPDGGVILSGWAADLERLLPAWRVVAFVDGRYRTQTAPGTSRPDVAAARGEQLVSSGFAMRIPDGAALLASGRLQVVAFGAGGEAAFAQPVPGLALPDGSLLERSLDMKPPRQ